MADLRNSSSPENPKTRSEIMKSVTETYLRTATPGMLVGIGYSSALETANYAAKKNPIQAPSKEPYTIPSMDVLKFRAGLVVEEFMELMKAMNIKPDSFCSVPEQPAPLDIYKIIDGCIDLVYVTYGVMVAMNVPDRAHLIEVCSCNNAKFPNGEAVCDMAGKYLKPPGWVGPDHEGIATVIKKILSAPLVDNFAPISQPSSAI